MRFELQRVERPIASATLCASIVVATGPVVLTPNVSEFGRLAGLIVEDWPWRAGRGHQRE